MTDQSATFIASALSRAWDVARCLRTAAFALFALLVLFGPFGPQILQISYPLLRPWTMFSAVGVGILKGEFIATGRDGVERRLTPLQVLGLDHYPVGLSFEHPMVVESPDDVRKIAQGFCADNDVDLAFRGFVGGRQGWQTLEADALCARMSYELRR